MIHHIVGIFQFQLFISYKNHGEREKRTFIKNIVLFIHRVVIVGKSFKVRLQLDHERCSRGHIPPSFHCWLWPIRHSRTGCQKSIDHNYPVSLSEPSVLACFDCSKCPQTRQFHTCSNNWLYLVLYSLYSSNWSFSCCSFFSLYSSEIGWHSYLFGNVQLLSLLFNESTIDLQFVLLLRQITLGPWESKESKDTVNFLMVVSASIFTLSSCCWYSST